VCGSLALRDEEMLSIEMSSNEKMPPEIWIALLGRRDAPVDGVEDYCNFLAAALAAEGVTLELQAVDWAGSGWFAALRDLARRAREWRGRWVIVQYTALGWSRRGFPLGALLAVRRLQRRGARVAVVFHEPERQLSGSRLVDRIRGALQDWIIARLYARAERTIFADPLETISWLPRDRTKGVFIPIGANIPAPAQSSPRTASVIAGAGSGTSAMAGGARPAPAGSAHKERLSIAIYCLSTLPNRERELADISLALGAAVAQGARLRAVFLGRGTEDSEDEIRHAIAKESVEVEILGLRDSVEISRRLAQSDVMLSVRGPLFPRRGSVIAGIACGLPIVAYSNGKSAFPLTEAGVELVPWHEPEALAAAFVRIALDSQLRQSLRAKSLRAYGQYLSWSVIARTFRAALRTSAKIPGISESSAAPQTHQAPPAPGSRTPA
jgi:glycosyltransferase involved in cell wall biosynthesis